MNETIRARVHSPGATPTLVYLPGLHGDWTLAGRFRRALGSRACFVEFTYPRSLDWDLDDYAQAVMAALRSHGITRGWLIGESFSSQVAWAMIVRQEQDGRAALSFQIEGVILSGGFVRYPSDWELCAGMWVQDRLPEACWEFSFACLVRLAGWLARHDALTRDDVAEFVARRTPEDRRAIQRRMQLLAEHDSRPAARTTRVPVYQLTARGDFIVPWRPVRRWLRAECPGYRATRVVPFSSHSVLFSRPDLAAPQILRWIESPANGT